jgi:hypothetical protein
LKRQEETERGTHTTPRCSERASAAAPPTPGVFAKEFGTAGKEKSCDFAEYKRVRKSVKGKKLGEKAPCFAGN